MGGAQGIARKRNNRTWRSSINLKKVQMFVVTLKGKTREEWLEDKLDWSENFSLSAQCGQWQHCLHHQLDYKDLGWLMKTQLFTANSGS